MKYIPLLCLVSLLFITSSNPAFAVGCPGATLNYTSANASACTPVISGPSSFSQSVAPNIPGSIPNITAVGPYFMTCGVATASDTLVNQASCCGTGSQVAQTYWTGTTCVIPTGVWTAPTCPSGPSNCGLPASNPPYSCLTGNGYCTTNTPATLACPATVACATGVLNQPASCQITNGNNTCQSSFTWSTTNPETPAVSQVIGGGGAGADSLPLNNGTNQSIEVKHTGTGQGDGQWFFLSHNSKQLDLKLVGATCIGSTAWDGTTQCMTCLNGGCTNNVCNNGADNPPWCSTGASMITGIITASVPSCIVPTGSAVCSTPITLDWNVTNRDAGFPVAVTRDGLAGELFSDTANPTVGQSTNVPYVAGGTVFYKLYHKMLELAQASVGVSCSAGANKWDTTPALSGGQICADPQTVSLAIKGNLGYGTPGLDFTCSLSNGYDILLNGAPFTSGTITPDGSQAIINVPITIAGNYSVICKHGSVSTDFPMLKAYGGNTPPGPTVSINATPKTIDRGGKTTVSWNAHFPPLAGCTLTAKTVCANNVCSPAQLANEALLATTIATEYTDANDTGNSGGVLRLITTAVSQLSPQYLDPLFNAVGKKTFDITDSTNFTLDCGGVKASTVVRVTNNNEQ